LASPRQEVGFSSVSGFLEQCYYLSASYGDGRGDSEAAVILPFLTTPSLKVATLKALLLVVIGRRRKKGLG
jgi:hypothetical protein